MSEREFSKISGLPVAIQPIASDTIVEIETVDGQSFQAPFSALGGMPASHGSTHQDGGSDEIGTEFPTANAIPKADDAGQLTDWIADASTNVKGKVQLAANNESAANKAVQSNDTRMSNARAPTAHAASHIGGTDDLGLGTAALLDVGVADGVCGLDSSGKVSSSNLPSYVDDVIEVANYAALPVTGETGKIYVTLDDNLTYRWTGSAYVEISKSLALGETSSTAYRGDRGKIAYDHSQSAHAPSNADNTQSAINGASGKTTPSDNDILALLDSDAGNALKKLLWSNVKATLKTYFDTLYTAGSGDTPANILAKLLTVDGSGSGLDADTLDGLHSSAFAPSGFGLGTTCASWSGADTNAIDNTGFYMGVNMANSPDPNYWWYVLNLKHADTFKKQFAFSLQHSWDLMYSRTLIGGVWGAWAIDYNSGNVGSGWATALGATLGSNWATALGAALGTGWTTALASTPSSIFGNLSVLYVEDTTFTDHTSNLPEIPGSSGSCALYIVRTRIGSVNISSYKSPTAHGFSMYFGWYPDVDQTPTAQAMITSFSGVAANTGIYTIAPTTAGADRYLISVLFASRA